MKSDDLYGLVTIMIATWEFYLCTIFMGLAVSYVDIGLNYISTKYRKHMIKIAVTLKDTLTLKALWSGKSKGTFV